MYSNKKYFNFSYSYNNIYFLYLLYIDKYILSNNLIINLLVNEKGDIIKNFKKSNKNVLPLDNTIFLLNIFEIKEEHDLILKEKKSQLKEIVDNFFSKEILLPISQIKILIKQKNKGVYEKDVVKKQLKSIIKTFLKTKFLIENKKIIIDSENIINELLFFYEKKLADMPNNIICLYNIYIDIKSYSENIKEGKLYNEFLLKTFEEKFIINNNNNVKYTESMIKTDVDLILLKYKYNVVILFLKNMLQ